MTDNITDLCNSSHTQYYNCSFNVTEVSSKFIFELFKLKLIESFWWIDYIIGTTDYTIIQEWESNKRKKDLQKNIRLITVTNV